VTFSRAAAHISNFTAGHETRVSQLGEARLAFPDNHIEIDNRLTWMLGRLEERFGNDAFYVHLTRDAEATALSFNHRWQMKGSIIAAYRDAILMGAKAPPIAVCADYVETVNANIRAFLQNKPRAMHFELEHAGEHWRKFWEQIGAEGDLQASLAEWEVRHHSTGEGSSLVRRAIRAARQLVRRG
jgi:hypothetical protein